MVSSRYRRVAVQLTPLLDMTLIVFFAQYIEVRQRAQTSVEAAGVAEAAQEMTAAEMQLLEQEYTRALSELNSERRDSAELRQAAQATAERAATAENRLAHSLAQQRIIGELVVELFGVPPEDVEAVLDPDRHPSITDSPEELAELRERFAEMAEQNPGAMIHHLLSYEEILKRCDVWELFIDADGIADFDSGMKSFRFRVIPEEFESELFSRYKSLPQSKGLVIILLTYDEHSQREFLDPVRESLPRLVDRMREDSGDRARFEYADVGIRID